MGIKGLAKLLSDEAPDCIREVELKSLHGRAIAIDASMAIYQFLIAVRSNSAPNSQAFMLTNAEGETTSHIQGMFNRTIRYMSEGIRPVFVFDGKPPSIKSGELLKRREKRQKAQEALQQATHEGNVAEQDKQSKRLVRAGQKENDDCRKLLTLMGVPVIQAPCEAEAQAAALAKAGKVYATGTEDMDALTFQTPVLVRKMTFATSSGNKSAPVQTMDHAKALAGLELTQAQFVDLCILLGCDYCDTIKGVGPKTALKLIRQHGMIETILQHLDRTKYGIPDSWIPNETKQSTTTAMKKQPPPGKRDKNEDPDDEDSQDEESPPLENSKNDEEKPSAAAEDDEDEEEEEEELIPAYVQARQLFNEHQVLDSSQVQLKWKPCQKQELTKFLVDEMCFNPDRVASSIDKLEKAYQSNKKPQMRMESFFKIKPNPNAAAAAKRKAEAAKKAKAAAKKKAKKR